MATPTAPAKKAAAKKPTTAPKPAAEKKTEPAKKAPAKKAAAKKSSSSSVKLGDRLFVDVDPKYNNGASQAPADVVQVLDVDGDPRVNLRVLLDSDSELYLRNVLVVSRAKAKKATEDGQRVAFTSAS